MFARKTALVMTLVAIATTVAVASAFAQAGPTNPSGGTGLRQTVEEGSGSLAPTGSFSRGLSIGWQSWLGTLAAYRHSFSVATRSSDARSLLAVARRHAWKR